MQEQWRQPSPIIYPIALQPRAEHEADHPETHIERWGWLEIFVLSQVFWGVLLFIPGSQAYRTYIRAFPYCASLIALVACARSPGGEAAVPGSRWLVAVFLLLVANLVHVSTWLLSGVAQIVFQVSIAAPVFWATRMSISETRLERLFRLIFAANFVSAALGLLQVYYPDRFLPGEFSALAHKLNPDFLAGFTYTGAVGQAIIRPPGLSDLPGGAAIAGTISAVLAFAFAVRTEQRQHWRWLYLAAAAIGITTVYLTQVRSMLLMILGCMVVMALIRLRQGRVVQSGWMAATAGALVFGAFAWAVTLGGNVLAERFTGIIDTGVVQSYRDNRGMFLQYTFTHLPWQFPFGAGLGRWGMMAVYFGDQGNWQYPALHAEIQPTGWVYDGGVLMWVLYGGALFFAMRYSYRLAAASTGLLNDLATMVFSMQLLVAGLCFTGPIFNTQIGILFWLPTAMLFGAERTEALRALRAEDEHTDG